MHFLDLVPKLQFSESSLSGGEAKKISEIQLECIQNIAGLMNCTHFDHVGLDKYPPFAPSLYMPLIFLSSYFFGLNFMLNSGMRCIMKLKLFDSRISFFLPTSFF